MDKGRDNASWDFREDVGENADGQEWKYLDIYNRTVGGLFGTDGPVLCIPGPTSGSVFHNYNGIDFTNWMSSGYKRTQFVGNRVRMHKLLLHLQFYANLEMIPPSEAEFLRLAIYVNKTPGYDVQERSLNFLRIWADESPGSTSIDSDAYSFRNLQYSDTVHVIREKFVAIPSMEDSSAVSGTAAALNDYRRQTVIWEVPLGFDSFFDPPDRDGWCVCTRNAVGMAIMSTASFVTLIDHAVTGHSQVKVAYKARLFYSDY